MLQWLAQKGLTPGETRAKDLELGDQGLMD
ncbi:hypothetical protein X765_32280 [Mesorhizobium sp. LSHC440B00]|nr:hypothetical protein X765_32280 [Mesorhizobium sp. LSHC440B00]